MTSEQHRRVLVVDDDREIRAMLAAALSAKALTVDLAADGVEAIELLREHAYAVVLLEVMLPRIDGFGVLNAIDETGLDAPIVLVITGAERQVLERLDSRRIHGIVRKPFEPHEIACVVATCAEIRGRSAFETMALATVMTGAPLIALLKL